MEDFNNDTEEYYGGCYPEPPEHEEEQVDWNEYQWELADIYHDELMLEEVFEEEGENEE